jgi:NADPH-dependent 2,4-dienoyl-CoA reductase/sulfur reductase-like enzyme
MQDSQVLFMLLLLLQVMPPFDPEMVEPVQERLAAKGVELCLGDGLKAFEQQVGRDASH